MKYYSVLYGLVSRLGSCYIKIFTGIFHILVLSCCSSSTLNYQKVDIEVSNFSYKDHQQIEHELKGKSFFGERHKNRIAATDFANIGDIRQASELWYKGYQAKAHLRVKCSNYQNTLESFFGDAQSTNLVFINEAFYNPEHKVLTSQLLEPLFLHGFRYLALDYPINDDLVASQLNNGEAPSFRHFNSVPSPSYGRLIRSAIELGYKIILYEAKSGVEGKQRWQEQAENLLKRIKEKGDKGGVIVHSGYSYEKKNNDVFSFPIATAKTLAQKYQIKSTKLEQVSADITQFECKSSEIDDKNYTLIDRKNIHNDNGQQTFWPDYVVAKGKRITLQHYNERLFKVKTFNLKGLPVSPPYLIASYASSDKPVDAIPLDIKGVDKSKMIQLVIPKSGGKLAIFKQNKFRLFIELEI